MKYSRDYWVFQGDGVVGHMLNNCIELDVRMVPARGNINGEAAGC